jgi:hypothetical protein
MILHIFCRDKGFDRDSLAPLDIIWKESNSSKKSWLKCWGHGLWRYFDPATDTWESKDDSDNHTLFQALEVLPYPRPHSVPSLLTFLMVCPQDRRKEMISLAEHCQQSGKTVQSRKDFRTPYGPVAMALYHSNVPFSFLKINCKSQRGSSPAEAMLCLHPYVRADGKTIAQYDSKFVQ